MKGLIDPNGNLHIERGADFKEMSCPHDNTFGIPCSDVCPLFGEPFTYSGVVHLALCQSRELKFSGFDDMRQREGMKWVDPTEEEKRKEVGA